MKDLKRLILIVFILQSGMQLSFAQMMIKEVKFVYKSKVDDRIISDKEFQSFRGRHTVHKLIKGKKGAIDTLLISPPKSIRSKKSLINKKAPIFSVTDIYGNAYTRDQLEGKVLVLNFWFVACPPCIQEIPELNDLVRSYEDNSDIIFLAFAKDTKTLLGKFLAHSEFEYSIIPNAKEVAKKFGVNAFPTHMIIDKKGIVRYTSIGFEKGSINHLKKEILKHIKS